MLIHRRIAFAGILAIVLLNSSLASAQIIPNRYILVLEDPPVAARFPARAELQSALASAYSVQIEDKQTAIRKDLASRNITVTGSASVLQNVIFVNTPASRAATIVDELKSIPGVSAVRPMRRFKPALNKATALMNAPAAWTAVGGPANAGAGIKIGILDSGIDQTHPAFQDTSLQMPAGFPKCTTGHPADCAYTSNKVIVARSYVRLLSAGSSSSNPAADDLPDDYSPRDRDGHGTGVASVAAGAPVTVPGISTTGAPFIIQGMAPKAYLGSYKIFGSPGVDEFSTDQALIQAVEDAVTDGMDVITTSLGSAALSDAASDPVAAAFEAAAKTGAVVIAAAGNGNESGYDNGFQYPSFNTISSPSNAPDVISVGATENSHVFLPSVSVNAAGAPSGLKGIPAQPSDTFNYPSSNGSATAPLIDVTQLGNNGFACNSLPAYSLDGAFALIEQGSCGFIAEATNAQNAGAIGIVFYMATSATPVPIEGLDPNDAAFTGPAVMISNTAGVALKSYVDANQQPSVTIDAAGTETDIAAWSQANGFSPAVTANMLISFSSTGPTPDGQLKPDLVATGGSDVYLSPDPGDPYLPAPSGMYMATQSYDPNQQYAGISFYSANRYWAADGTSFAAPLTAGVAALVKQAHAKQSLRGTQIRSLLVNSTSQGMVFTDDFGDPVDTQWIGAGLLNAASAVNATITAEPATVSFGILTAGLLPINKSIMLTNIGSSSATLAASVHCCSVNTRASTPSGVQVTLSQSSIVLAAGASSNLVVTLNGAIPSPSEYSGSISLQQGSAVVAVIPFLFLVGDGVPFNVNVVGAGGEGAPGADLGASMIVQIVDQYGVPVANSSVPFIVSPRGGLTLKSVSGEPACSPASSTISTTCRTDQFGFAYADVVLGSNPNAAPTVTFNASGASYSAAYNIQAPPAVTGVADAAAGLKQLVPGSYAAIYGTGLTYFDFSDANGTVLGPNTIPTTVASDPVVANGAVLPLQIDLVTVSFDVPAAGISVPGHLTYVSPSQVNVQIPWELQGQSSVQMKVTLDGDLYGNVVTVPLAAASPAFFTNSGTVIDALDSNNKLIGTSNPAKRGQRVSLYANGLGVVSNQPASGDPAGGSPLSQTTLTATTVTIGGQTAPVSFSGLTPSLPGLYQINVTVPSNIGAGVQNVTVAIGGVTSPVATLPVQ